MSGGSSHEHIAEVKFSDGTSCTVEQEIRQLKNGDTDYVQDALGNRAYIKVRVRTLTEYIQTERDGKWTDNLLSLPTF